MKLRLTAISGSREGKEFLVEPKQCVTFGRTTASMWSFEDDGHMSSVHFEVENQGEIAEVRDRGSTNGTWLNNHRIAKERLQTGDRLRAGKTILTVEFLEATAEPQEDTPVALPKVSAEEALPAPSTDIKRPLVSRPSAAPSPSALPPLPDAGPLPSTDRTPASVAPLPSSGRLPNIAPLSAASRRINPFDSVDFDESSGTDETPNIASAGGNLHLGNNPISDSSFSIGTPPAENASDVQLHANQRRLARQTKQEAADSFAIVLDSLAQKWSIQLLLHFQKIRTDPPASLTTAQPLFHWLTGSDASSYSPIRVAWNDPGMQEECLALLPRLCRADACLAVLGRSVDDLTKQIDGLLSVGIEGHSEPNGFLPFCWPSSVATILDVSGPSACQTLFGHAISGVIMCSAWDRQRLLAVTDADLAEDLAESEFKDVNRIVGI